MRNNFEQYDAFLNGAAEVTSACLDMEGGAFFLAWSCELIRELTEKGYVRSAVLTVQKLCEAVGSDCAWAGCEESEPIKKQAWLNLFAETLMAHVMTVAE